MIDHAVVTTEAFSINFCFSSRGQADQSRIFVALNKDPSRVSDLVQIFLPHRAVAVIETFCAQFNKISALHVNICSCA